MHWQVAEDRDRLPDEGPIAVSLDVSAVPDQPAGAGRYVVEIVRALGRLEGSDERLDLTLVARRGDRVRWGDLAPMARLVDPVPSARPVRLAYERLLLGSELGRLTPPVEVHHGPHYTLPGSLGTIGKVVTIHDLTFFDHPEWHERSKVPVFRDAIKRAARTADVLVFVSEATARRFGSLFRARGETVVAPHGVDPERFAPVPDGDDRYLASLGLGRSRPYVLHLGTIEPRKGLVELVAAFGELVSSKPDLDLVLAGIPGWGAAEIDRAIADRGLAARVHRLGWVPDEALPALLRSAAVVAYPSHEEGFGLPALEALACGARLVTTAGTAMSEMAGEAAWTAPPSPRGAGALAEVLARALGAEPDEVARRRALGLERARSHSWRSAAESHVAAYRLARSAAAERRPGRRRNPR
jgi:glycosyltransferase involved in cell wall biosynthesis